MVLFCSHVDSTIVRRAETLARRFMFCVQTARRTEHERIWLGADGAIVGHMTARNQAANGDQL